MKKLTKKQIFVIALIAFIVALYILAFVFAISGNETLQSWAWACFALSIVIPFFIYFHFLILNWIRKTREVDEIQEKISKKDETASDEETQEQE
ncbi:MAG: hypothetical protein IKX10_09380 [Lachnospiraceae bacterium]|nr:hypothetical protein [Lachnospiraceae bacterium]